MDGWIAGEVQVGRERMNVHNRPNLRGTGCQRVVGVVLRNSFATGRDGLDPRVPFATSARGTCEQRV